MNVKSEESQESHDNPRKIALVWHSNAPIKNCPNNPDAPFGSREHVVKSKEVGIRPKNNNKKKPEAFVV